MIIKVTKSIFNDEFKAVRPDNFTYSGLSALFDYLDEYEQEPDIELDVIAICCDFCQYDSIYAACIAQDMEDGDDLAGNTTVIECTDGSVIIQNF